MPDKEKELEELLPLIGEFVIRFSSIIGSMEYFLVDWIKPFTPGWNIESTGADLKIVLRIYEKEMIILIEKSPWITKKQKATALRKLKRLIGDVKILSKYRNIVVHGTWWFWEKNSPYVGKGQKRTRSRENYKITKELVTELIQGSQEIEREIFDTEQEYRYGEGIRVSKILLNRYQKQHPLGPL